MLERRGMLLKVAVSGLVLGAAAGCDEKGKEVGAVEDLMREHRVIRRAILVYRADTVVFPAWKKALSGSELFEMGEKFEEIEKKRFGEDGFEKAVREIDEIEQSTGMAQLAQFTPG